MEKETPSFSQFFHLRISTSKNEIYFGEKRFSKDIPVGILKAKLEMLTGASYQTMQLEAYDMENKFICNISDDEKLLNSYPIDNGMRIHIVDKFSFQNELDTGDVEKYVISQEEYLKKEDSVRAFLERHKLGHFSEEYLEKKRQTELEEKSIFDKIKIHSRCRVTVSDVPPRLGVVKYKGEVEGLSGYWIGVQFDQPLGKHNGTFNGKLYFECPDKYGTFVKAQNVEIDNFEEKPYDFNEEI